MLRALSILLLVACTRPEVVSRDLGGPCLSSADCSARCLSGPAWPGGFCTRSCAGDRDCPVGSACADGVCLYQCFDDQDCAFLQSSYACRARAAALVCAPDLPDAGSRDAT